MPRYTGYLGIRMGHMHIIKHLMTPSLPVSRSVQGYWIIIQVKWHRPTILQALNATLPRLPKHPKGVRAFHQTPHDAFPIPSVGQYVSKLIGRRRGTYGSFGVAGEDVRGDEAVEGAWAGGEPRGDHVIDGIGHTHGVGSPRALRELLQEG